MVQWATGNIGARALREVLRHPALDLVGVLVYDPAKAGVDAGTLCGEDPMGVAATTDPGAIHALRADCVLYIPRRFELDHVVALLESGTNVVTTRGEPLHGAEALGDDGRARLLAACEQGGSSIYATGSSPGFVTDALPYALLSLQRDVESVEIEELADMSRRDSPHMLFELLRFGQPLEALDPNRGRYLLAEFGPALRELAAAAALEVDEWSCETDAAVARRTTRLVAGEVAAGTVGALRTSVVGRVGDRDAIRFTASWYCTADVEPAWDLRATGWRVRVRGEAPLDVDLAFPVPLDDLGAHTPSYTANRPVNAIPYVCDAAPGILSTLDLPPITPAGPRATRVAGVMKERSWQG